jgi:type VI secretion system protein VasD
MIRRRDLLLLPAALAAGCAPPPPKEPPAPPVLKLTIAAGANQNPAPSGQPNPVAVRLFMLGATAKFERADIFALTEHEQQTLGGDSLGSEEFLVRPGENLPVTRNLKPGVQFIGITVLFRDIEHARWRAIAPVAPSGVSERKLTINGLAVTLA